MPEKFCRRHLHQKKGQRPSKLKIMDKNLQNIDDVFNKAYNSFEEQPSAAAWEKLNAALDKEDAEKYKRRFIGWKRIAVILILLLSGLVIYETKVITQRKTDVAEENKLLPGDTAYLKSENANNTRKSSMNDDLNIMPERTEETVSNSTEQSNSVVTVSPEDKTTAIPLNEKKEQQVTVDNKVIALTLKNKSSKSSRQRTTIKITNSTTAETGNNENTADEPKTKEGKTNTVNTVQPVPNEYVLQRVPVAGIEPLKRVKTDLTASLKLLNMPVTLPPNLIANDASKAKQKKKPNFKPYWSITLFASSDWGQYTLDNDVHDNNSINLDEKEEINKREKHETSFSTGVFVSRQFTKRLGVKTGIIYSNTAIAINPQEMYASQKTDGSIAYKYITSSGYGYVKPGFGLPPAIGDSILSLEAQHNLQVLSIPFMVSYKMDSKNFSLIPSAGITANFITGSNVKTEVTDALNKEAVSINGLDGMRSLYAGFMADVNLQYNYNKRWSFNLLPSFKYALTPITRSNVVKTFPYSFNIGAGITYKF